MQDSLELVEKKNAKWKYAVVSGLTVGATLSYIQDNPLVTNAQIQVTQIQRLAFQEQAETLNTSGNTVAALTKNDLQIKSEANIVDETSEVELITTGTVQNIEKETETISYTQPITYETEYKANSNMYKDESQVVQSGQNGVLEVVVYLESLNGEEVFRQTIAENVIQAPANEIIEYGTKEKVVAAQFTHPTKGIGYISSSYGTRWGTFHGGIDIAAGYGTPIYAAAAGKVTYSGYMGTYGYLVIIDHGNGYETYYAHASKLNCYVGQTVSQGEKIAEVGSTGDSSGNHVHFEIRQNGNRIDPYSYIY